MASTVIDSWLPALPEPTTTSVLVPTSTSSTIRSKINAVNQLVHSLMAAIPNYNGFDNLILRCEELLQLLTSDIQYEGDDEAKQKQNGRVLGDRRKKFFQLVKSTSECMGSSRRGLQVKSEYLTMKSLTNDTPRQMPNAQKIAKLVTESSLSRNLVMRHVARLNSQQSPHVTSQVPIQILDHIKGSS